MSSIFCNNCKGIPVPSKFLNILRLKDFSTFSHSIDLNCAGNGLKVTRYVCSKNSINLQLLDVQACNSANKGFLSDFEKMVY